MREALRYAMPWLQYLAILGVVPLALAHGAGAEMRSTLGIAVFSGMLGVTIFGIFLTPIFFYVIQRLFAGKGGATSPPSIHSAETSGHASETGGHASETH